MEQELKELMALNSVQDKLKKQFVKNREEFDTANYDLVAEIGKLSESIDKVKIDIVAQTLKLHKETGEKQFLGGVGIRVMHRMDYDAKVAQTWAQEHDLALKLDRSAFEKIAKVDKPDFVKFYDEAQVTFPKEIKLDGGENDV